MGIDKLLKKVGANWDTAVLKKVEMAWGGTAPGAPSSEGTEVVKKAAQDVINETATKSLLMFVLNGPQHRSRARLHRPRDRLHAYCGWPWSRAVSEGFAMPLTLDLTPGYLRCDRCEDGGSESIVVGSSA